MLWDSSCGPFTRQTKNLAHRLIFLLGHHARLPMLIKQPKILAYIICPPGDRSGGQSITIYIRFMYAGPHTILTTLFLFSDHFQSSVELLKGVDKYIIKLVTLVNVVYSSKSRVDRWSIYYILCIHVLILQGGL